MHIIIIQMFIAHIISQNKIYKEENMNIFYRN